MSREKEKTNRLVAEEHQELRYAFSEEILKSYYASIWAAPGEEQEKRNAMYCNVDPLLSCSVREQSNVS